MKSGFTSGYSGVGPHALSYVLGLLDLHGVKIEEYEVTLELLGRVDDAALTVTDIEDLDARRPIRPSRWSDYVSETHWERARNGTLWRDFPPLIPFAIVDPRLSDLAMSFWAGPDERLLTAYRRLEDIVRKRTGLKESGSKLFSQAFAVENSRLVWKDIETAEQNGRASLFTGMWMAYRNPRAHRESRHGAGQQLSEFLLLNHLFVLERQAQKRRSRREPKQRK
ncbi:MAG: TIGR02391 family protein [Thermoanaerobaculia bacterium]